VESVNVTTVLLLYKPLSTSCVFGPKATIGKGGGKIVIVSLITSVHEPPATVAVTTRGPGVVITLDAVVEVPVNGADQEMAPAVVDPAKPGLSTPRVNGAKVLERLQAVP
jgi:hypothetical protein